MNQNAKEIIQRVRQQLGFIKEAIADIRARPGNGQVMTRAFANILTAGRSTTFVLQNLRSAVGKEEFDKWYEPKQEEMKNDELLCAFRDARNEFEKQGKLNTYTSSYINHLDGSILQRYMANRPANAVDFFIGDTIGGSGWTIELPDGTTEKIYVDLDLPGNIVTKIFFVKQGIKHKGVEIEDTTVENCSELLYNYLKQLVDEAAKRFL